MKRKFTKLLMLLGAFLFLGAGEALADKVVYFEKPSGWEECYVHYWGGQNSTTWPGRSDIVKPITANNNKVYFKATIPYDDVNTVIFHNNKGDQTEDLPFTNGDVFNWETNKKGQKNEKIGTISENNGTYTFNANGSSGGTGSSSAKVYFTGDFNNWDRNTSYDLNSDGIATYQIALPSDNSGFKIEVKDGNTTKVYSTHNKVQLNQWFNVSEDSNNGSSMWIDNSKSGEVYKFEWNNNKTELMVTFLSSSQGNLDDQNQSSNYSRTVYLMGIDGNFEKNKQYKFNPTNFSDDLSDQILIVTLTSKLQDNNSWEGQKFQILDIWREESGNWNGSAYNRVYVEADGKINMLEYDKPDTNKDVYFKFKGTKTFLFKYWPVYNDGSDNHPAIQIIDVSNPSYPEHIFIQGYLNNQDWKDYNCVELKNQGNGLYVADEVEISGIWSPKDTSMGTGRKKYASTGDENYVAFFAKNKVEDELPKFKYGATEFHNVDVFQKDASGNYPSENSQTREAVYLEHGTSHNFKVAEGFYKVTLNLNEDYNTFKSGMSATFERIKVKPRVYVWFNGDNEDNNVRNAELITGETTDDHDLGAGNAYYRIDLKTPDTTPNVIQVGIGKEPEHRVARQCEYLVWKRTGNTQGVRKYLDKENPVAPASGYELAEKDEDYEVIGSSSFDDNHLIKLKNEGHYIIEADLATEGLNSAVANLYEVTGSKIEVAVVNTDVQVVAVNTSSDSEKSDTYYEPFSTTGTVTLSAGITFDKAIEPSNFTVTLVPKDNAEGWATSTATEQENIEKEYKTALAVPGSGLVQQWEDLGGTAAIVDGFYNGKESLEGSLSNGTQSGDNYSYDINLPVPCSGLYQLTIAPTTESGITLSGENVDNIGVEIYPYLYGEFGSTDENVAYGFNIDGFMWTKQNGDYVINFFDPDNNSAFDEDEYNSYNWDRCLGYTPGTYFAKTLTTSSPATSDSKSVKRYADEAVTYIDMPYFTEINLSGFEDYNDGKGTQLKVTSTKNGATGEFIFYVNRKATSGNVSTGVETIETVEDGEAVYYNLQGVKVANPDKGIYVKVQNGKATKVVM